MALEYLVLKTKKFQNLPGKAKYLEYQVGLVRLSYKLRRVRVDLTGSLKAVLGIEYSLKLGIKY